MFDGVAVENDEHLVQMVGLSPSGRPVELQVLRERATLQLTANLTPISTGR
jgi:S1-C subfamily serine protease